MENPKLALIPSGYKDGTVYSILPVDGVGDFDVTRGSNATRINKDGLIETVTGNTPRLDWLNSDCPSLLLEPQRTNLITYSEDFTQWLDTGITVTPNAIISPSGDLTADKLQSTANNWRRAIFINTISGTLNTVSAYVKRDDSTNTVFATIEVQRGGGGVASSFNLSTGLISGTLDDPFIIDVGNGWYRIGGTYTSNQVSNIIYIYPSSGYGISGTMFFWGAQAEQGSYPTSYIKTEDGIATRNQDFCTDGGDADLFNITEGTFFVDVTPFKASTFHRITLSNNTSNEEIIILFYSNNTQVGIISESGGSGQVSYTTNITFDTKNKLAFTFKKNEFKFYVNGNLVHTDTSGNIATGLNSLHFAGNNGGFNYFQGKVHDTRVYNIVLTEAEAIKLTT